MATNRRTNRHKLGRKNFANATLFVALNVANLLHSFFFGACKRLQEIDAV